MRNMLTWCKRTKCLPISKHCRPACSSCPEARRRETTLPQGRVESGSQSRRVFRFAHDVIEHRFGHDTGIRVVARAMIAAENGEASVFVARAMTEGMILAFQIECLNHAG